jgi:hypothetical protein
VYVPVAKPLIFVDIPLPVVVVPPGVLVNIHVPDEGKPLNTTEPVAKAQVGCVIVPTVGGCTTGGSITVTVLVTFVQRFASFTVTVYGDDAAFTVNVFAD